MNEKEQIEEKLTELYELIKHVMSELNLSSVPEVKIEGDEDEKYVSIDEWITIYPEFKTVEIGIGKAKKSILFYQLQHVVYDPGVRYYPDGSGEPPSTDVCNDDCEQSMCVIIEKAIFMYFRNEIDAIFMAHGEARMYEEEQQYLKEMDDEIR